MTTPSPDPAALSGYIGRLFAPEDDVLRELREESRRHGLPQISIAPEVGKLLQVLLTAVGARRVLEIGTLAGYSTIWMARALPPGGRVVTLEIDANRAALAREFSRRAGLGDAVEVRVGIAGDALSRLAEEGEPFDACFIDADKESYPLYLRWARELVRPGGLILADNAFWRGAVLQEPPPDDDTLAIQDFNRHLARSPELCSTIIPIGDGLAVAVIRTTGAEASGQS